MYPNGILECLVLGKVSRGAFTLRLRIELLGALMIPSNLLLSETQADSSASNYNLPHPTQVTIIHQRNPRMSLIGLLFTRPCSSFLGIWALAWHGIGINASIMASRNCMIWTIIQYCENGLLFPQHTLLHLLSFRFDYFRQLSHSFIVLST